MRVVSSLFVSADVGAVNSICTSVPFRVEFVARLRKVRVTLAENESGLSFDLLWEGNSQPYLEEHHVATRRGKRTTDQTRYAQVGKAEGWINFRGNTRGVTPDTWTGARDNSWGIYAERPPFGAGAKLFASASAGRQGTGVAFVGGLFQNGSVSGFYHLHETPDGEQCVMNDVFGTSFAGLIHRGWDDEVITLASGHDEMTFQTRYPDQTVAHSIHITAQKNWRSNGMNSISRHSQSSMNLTRLSGTSMY